MEAVAVRRLSWLQPHSKSPSCSSVSTVTLFSAYEVQINENAKSLRKSSGISSARVLRAVRARSAGLPNSAGGTSSGVGVAQNLAEEHRKWSRFHIPYSKGLERFAAAAIAAYECGFTEESLIQELRRDANEWREGELQALADSVTVVWCTCQRLPQFVSRWSVRGALSEASSERYRGACAMITSAWFEQRMSWFPVGRLQMELEMSLGRLVTQDEATEVARIVYATLEAVAPQFPTK